MLLILAEALTTVIHLINLSYAIAFNGDVAARVWSGKNVSYNDLKGFFGCKAFENVPKDERSKLYAKTRRDIFFDYGQD